MFDKYLFPLSILPLQGFGDHVKEEGGFGFIKSDLFMEMFGDTSMTDPMIIKVSQADGAEVTVTAVPHNEDDGVFVPDWAFEILNQNEPVDIEKVDINELPLVKTVVVRMFIENESVKDMLEEHFYDFKVLHNNMWFKINDETIIVEHLLGEDGTEVMLGRLTDELAVTINISKDIEPIAEPIPTQPVMETITESAIDMTEERSLVPPAPPTEEEKRAAREARLRYFGRQA
jgi:hypothetical protein